MSTGVEKLVAIAKSYAPCNINTEKVRYLNLVGPNETTAMRMSMLSMSGCALTMRGFWRLAGVQHRILDTPYIIGHAIADILEIARYYNAWIHCEPTLAQLPTPGDVVFIGGNGHGFEHVFMVVDTNPNDSLCFDIVQGGLPNIDSATVKWSVKNGTVYHGSRPVNGYVSALALGLPDTTEIWHPPQI